MIVRLADLLSRRYDPRVLDVGCGEGKNAYYLAKKQIQVDAFDISELAIANARAAWPQIAGLRWSVADITMYQFGANTYDAAIATGSLHCLSSESHVADSIKKLQDATFPGGYNVISVFNDRRHDLRGHSADFAPVLLPHAYYLSRYENWHVIEASDNDLDDIHPNIMVRHIHSITRLLATKRSA